VNPTPVPTSITGEMTPSIADLLHIGAIHRRRVLGGRSSDVDRQALERQLHQVQAIWPPQSPQRRHLQPSLQTIIALFEDYLQTGAHAEDLDTLLQRALFTVTPNPPDDLTRDSGHCDKQNPSQVRRP